MTDSTVKTKQLAWRCRRGMLELDLILAPLANYLNECSQDQYQQAKQLLELEDTELWDILVKGDPAREPSYAALVNRLRKHKSLATN